MRRRSGANRAEFDVMQPQSRSGETPHHKKKKNLCSSAVGKAALKQQTKFDVP